MSDDTLKGHKKKRANRSASECSLFYFNKTKLQSGSDLFRDTLNALYRLGECRLGGLKLVGIVKALADERIKA